MPFTLATLATLAALAAFAVPPVRPVPAAVETDVASIGPGLGLRVTAAAGRVAHEGLEVHLTPVHVGWEIREGASSKPSRFGAALLGLSYGDWLEARGLELDAIHSVRLGTQSIYVSPFALSLRHGVRVVPGSIDLSARLDLTLSLWQSTQAEAAPVASPLPCSSGSIAQATIEATIHHELSLALVAGVSDDPIHFDDGSDCIGGGDVWRSSSWVGARAATKLDRTWSLILEAGHTFEELHSVVEQPEEHGGHAHEHVALRSAAGFEAGAWLAAGF